MEEKGVVQPASGTQQPGVGGSQSVQPGTMQQPGVGDSQSGCRDIGDIEMADNPPKYTESSMGNRGSYGDGMAC